MTVTTADTDQGYAALKTAQNFFKDAVDYSLKGKLIEITQLFDDYLRNDCKVTARDLLNDFKSEGKTLMHVATSGGHSNIVDYFVTLLKSPKCIKDLINSADDRGYTPLINATISESDSIMKTLIQHGVDINAVNKDGAGAIHFAAGDGNVARLTLLTEKGANILTMSQSGNALHWAAGKGRSIYIDTHKYICAHMHTGSSLLFPIHGNIHICMCCLMFMHIYTYISTNAHM
jgi:hypothetical protein